MRYVSRSVESMRPCEIQLYRVGYGLPSHCDATCADGCWMMFLCADCTYVSLRPPAFSGCRRPCPCPCPPPSLVVARFQRGKPSSSSSLALSSSPPSPHPTEGCVSIPQPPPSTPQKSVYQHHYLQTNSDIPASRSTAASVLGYTTLLTLLALHSFLLHRYPAHHWLLYLGSTVNTPPKQKAKHLAHTLL